MRHPRAKTHGGWILTVFTATGAQNLRVGQAPMLLLQCQGQPVELAGSKGKPRHILACIGKKSRLHASMAHLQVPACGAGP